MTDRPSDKQRIDLGIVIDYYRPYVSGLTEVARFIAEGLAGRGYRVEVVCGRHDPELAPTEVIEGVRVRRCAVRGHVGKALIQPGFPAEVARLAKRSRLLQPHLPLPEGLACRAWGSAPIVPLYQCDAVFPGGTAAARFAGWLMERAVDLASAEVLRRSTEVVVSSQDYLTESRMQRHATMPVNVIPPPVRTRPLGSPSFRRTRGPHVGFLGRIVAEKGLDVLLGAVALIDEPDLRVLIGGDFEAVAGGSVVDSLRAGIAADPRVELLGFIPDAALPDFFASLDLFVLPSVNRLEAFGITQVEAMIAGVPVVASDLPGVRVPVSTVGFGRLAPPGDPVALAAAIRAQLDRPLSDDERDTMRRTAEATFGADAVLDRHEELLMRLRAS